MRTPPSPADREVDDLAQLLLALPPDTLDEFVAHLDPNDLAVVELAMGDRLAMGWRGTPDAMMHRLTRGAMKRWAYVRLLGSKFRDAVEGTSKRQIWNMPARYGKSLLGSQWGPAWALDRDPTEAIMLISYADRLADENAIAVRDILREHRDVLRAQLRRDRQRQDQFKTTEGGGLLAGGILSSLSGFGATGAVVDDPFKNWQEAHSEARRELVKNQYRSVVRLRLNTDDAWIIVIHTRWHEDDLTGYLLGAMEDGTGEAWDLVRLPALADDYDPLSLDRYARLVDPLGRAPGQIIEPERFSEVAVKERLVALGSYLSAGLEQQRPAPEEGGELKRAWWRLETTLPTRWDDAITSWDMKLKDREAGDFVVGQVWVRTGSDYWMLDQLRGQWNQATTANAIALMSVRHPDVAKHIIENTGYGPEVMATLRQPFPGYTIDDEMAGLLGMTESERVEVEALRHRGLPGLLPETPKGDKAVRARAQSPYVEAGNCHLPERASWLGTFLDETAAFPNASHDDQVDAWSQAMKRLARGPATVRAAHGTLPGRTPTRMGPERSLRIPIPRR